MDNASLANDFEEEEVQMEQEQESDLATDPHSEIDANSSEEPEEAKQEEDNYATGAQTQASIVRWKNLLLFLLFS